MTDLVHNVVIIVILLFTILSVYATSDEITDEQLRLAYAKDTIEEETNLKRTSRVSAIVGVGIVITIVALWLVPMYASHYIFSKECTVDN